MLNVYKDKYLQLSVQGIVNHFSMKIVENKWQLFGVQTFIRECDVLPDTTMVTYLSQEHRVLFPEEEKLHHPRRSIAFFFRPDDNAVIKCLDGSDKYPPIEAGKYISELLSNTYQYQTLNIFTYQKLY